MLSVQLRVWGPLLICFGICLLLRYKFESHLEVLNETGLYLTFLLSSGGDYALEENMECLLKGGFFMIA